MEPLRAVHLPGVVLLLGFAVVAAALTDPRVARVPAPPVRAPQEPAPASPAPTDPSRLPPGAADPGGGSWSTAETAVLSGILLLVLLAGALALLLPGIRDRVTLRRSAPLVSRTAPAPTAVRAAVEAGMHELDVDEGDPRAAVIACWLRLEHAAAAAGTRREAADTPGDLVARMLSGHRVSAGTLERLAGAYRRARYAPHDVGEETRDQARAALRRVHAELSTAPVATPVPQRAGRNRR